MAENSKIEWTDHTFNPWRGCTKVSPGCANCYAETLSHRNPAVLGMWGKGKPRKYASKAMWAKPLKWNRDAEHGIVDCPRRRPRVFCASLSDWLDDEVPIEWLADLLRLIHDTPNLDWLLLTKRPQNFRPRLFDVWHETPGIGADLYDWVKSWDRGRAPENIWMGTSVEDQTRADERIPELLRIPARVRFLSCEPLLGPVSLPRIHAVNLALGLEGWQIPGIHWVIAGGESGTDARPMRPEWVRGLRDQCAAAGVPFLFKQWGEWGPWSANRSPSTPTDGPLYRIGKKRAGRTLDGKIHHEFPKP